MININDEEYFLNDINEYFYSHKHNNQKNDKNRIFNTSIISKNKLGSISFTKNLCDLDNNNKRSINFNDKLMVCMKKNKKY